MNTDSKFRLRFRDRECIVEVPSNYRVASRICLQASVWNILYLMPEMWMPVFIWKISRYAISYLVLDYILRWKIMRNVSQGLQLNLLSPHNWVLIITKNKVINTSSQKENKDLNLWEKLWALLVFTITSIFGGVIFRNFYCSVYGFNSHVNQNTSGKRYLEC